MRLFPLLLLGALTVGACGYAPTYGTRGQANTEVRTSLAAVHVAFERDRLAQQVRNGVIDRLPPPVRPRYTMDLDVSSQRLDRATEADAEVTRREVRVIAQYSVIQSGTAEVVATGRGEGRAAYNVTRNFFATEVAREDAIARAADVAAEQVVLQLSVTLRREASDR